MKGFSERARPDISSPSNKDGNFCSGSRSVARPSRRGRFHEGFIVALCVGGARRPGDDLDSPRSFSAGSKGLVFPQMERIDRLDVVMAVKQHG